MTRKKTKQAARRVSTTVRPNNLGQSSMSGWWMIGALLVGAILRVSWALILPYNDAPDEFCHFAMVQHWRATGWPPTMADVPDRVPTSLPTLPPFGYLPCLATYGLVAERAPGGYLWARMGNVLVGVATLWMSYRAALTMLPARPVIALSVVWVLALHPQLAFVHSYVNNDTCAILFATMLWWFWIAALDSPPYTWCASRAALLGILSGLAVLAKLNTLGVALAGVPLVMAALCRQPTRWKQPCAMLGIALATAFLLCLPWFLWSLHYHGCLYGVSAHQAWWRAYQAEREPMEVLTWSGVIPFFWMTWKSYWAMFGYCTTWLHPAEYLSWTMVCLLAFWGFFRRPWAALTNIAPIARLSPLDPNFSTPEKPTSQPTSKENSLANPSSPRPVSALHKNAKKNENLNQEEPSENVRWRAFLLGCCLATGIVLVLAIHVAHSCRFVASPQGRYLFPASWAIAVVLAVGASSLPWPRAGYGLACLLAALILFHASSLRIEILSNIIAQPSMVKGRLLAYATGLPPHTGQYPANIDFPPNVERQWKNDVWQMKNPAQPTAAAFTFVLNGKADSTLVFDIQRVRGSMERGWIRFENHPVAQREKNPTPQGGQRVTFPIDIPAGGVVRLYCPVPRPEQCPPPWRVGMRLPGEDGTWILWRCAVLDSPPPP